MLTFLNRRMSLLVLLGLLGSLAAGGFAPGLVWAQAQSRDVTINQVRSYDWPTITVNFNLKSLDNTPLGTVGPDQFTVEENGIAQQVTQVALARDLGVPLSVVMVLDTSGSMAGPKLAAAQQAGITFMRTLSATDEIAFLPFSTQIPPVTPFTQDRTIPTTALNKQVAQGDTALYDALLTAARTINSAKAGNRRAIVLLTDGQDTASRNTLDFALAAVRQAGAIVYTVGVGGDTDDKVLKAMSEPTGGRFIKAADPAQLNGIYEELARELAGQYLLTFTSTTRVSKAYEYVRITLTYKTPSGQVVTREIRYRPPVAALLPTTPPPVPTAPRAAVVPLPAGLPLPPTPPPTPVVTPSPVAAPAAAADVGAGQGLRLLASFLAAIGVLLAFGGMFLLSAPSAVRTRMSQYVAGQPVGGTVSAKPPDFTMRVLYPLFNTLGARFAALTPGNYLEQIQRLLYQAGPPYRMTRLGFLGLQAGAGIGGMLLALLWAVTSKAGLAMGLLVVFLGLFIGAYIPYFLLVRRVTKRKKALLRALPAALDFLAIMVEAGTGFDAGLAELTRRWQNTLTDEFALLLIDFQIGKPRRDAWRDLTLRTQVQELTAFAIAVMQSEQTGSSISALLRTQADQMRTRRRQRAEEEARMAPVKMLIPMALFIFPCILIVILGPAIPQIMTSLAHPGQ